MKIFHICTIANNLEQYSEMKSSFLKAGFTEDECRYSLFDNSNGNIHEPYSTFNKIQESTTEPYIIFCHQDILLDQGHGFDQLIKIIEELNQKDSEWAVSGNAGFNNVYQYILRIKDPVSLNQWKGDFPQKVHSLDENFLVIRTDKKVFCSSNLSGFHLYASDLCLNSIIKGYSCYVIDFYLTHLSPGNFNQQYFDAQKRFQKRWNQEFSFLYIIATCHPVFLSRYRLARRIFMHSKVKNYLLNAKFFHRLLSFEIQRLEKKNDCRK